MKKITLTITVVLLVVNILFGFLLSSFSLYNIGFSSIIILLTGGFIFLLRCVKMEDAFAISLSFIFAVMGVIEYILAICSPEQTKDNDYIIAVMVMVTIQLILLIICNLTSKTIK